MKNRIDPGHGFDNERPVGKISENIIDAGAGSPGPFRLPVEHAHAMAPREKRVDHMRADETAAAKDQGRHHQALPVGALDAHSLFFIKFLRVRA